ncbi:MAG TPA: RNA helicase, partial [Caulobacteraceae bacterium]
LPSFDRRNDRALGALAAVEKTTMPPEPRRPQPQGRGGQPDRNRRRGRPNQGNGQGQGHGQGHRPQTAGPRPIAATQPAKRWNPVDA